MAGAVHRLASPSVRVTVVLMLSGWLGASMLFGAVLAPAAFRVLPSRMLAGMVVGGVLPSVLVAGVVCGGGLAAAAVGHASRRRRSVCLVAALLLAGGCATGEVIAGWGIDRVRGAIDGPIGALADNDPRRIAFGRLHGLSVAALGVAMAGAVLGLAALLPSILSQEKADAA